MTPFRLAYLNLTRRKVPSLVALVAIGISVACAGTLLRLYTVSHSRFQSLASGGDALIGAKAGGLQILLGALNLEGRYPDFIPYVLYASLKDRKTVRFEDGAQASPGYIREVIPFLYFARVNDYRVIGTDESFMNRPEPNDKVQLAVGRWASGENEAVVGYDAARREGWKPGDKIVTTVWASAEEDPSPAKMALTVTGVFQPMHSVWDRAIFSNLPTAQTAIAQAKVRGQSIWNEKVLHYYLVYLEPGGFGPLEALINKRTVAQVVSVPKEKEALEELTGTGKKLGLFMVGLILLLGGLSVAAMMVTRFEAMTVQLAVLRALGYAKREIFAWLLWEGCLLGATACAFGAVLDWLAFPLLRSALGSALPPPYLVDSALWQSAWVWVCALLATVAATLLPMKMVYSQNVHDSLKGF